MPSSLNILISGAGIAGPAVAFWLSRQGHRCTVIERFPSLRTAGLQIDIRQQGIDAIKRMGLIDVIKKRVVDEQGFQMVNSAGKRAVFLPRHEPDAGRAQSFSSEFEIMRGDLTAILYDETKDKVKYRFGLSVQEYRNEGEQVSVTLSDSSVETYDLLIAADGQGSRIRRQMLQETGVSDDTRHLGLNACYYFVPRQDGDENLATLYQAPGRKAILTRWHSKDQGQAILLTMANQEGFKSAMQSGVDAQKAEYAKTYDGAGWQTSRLLSHLPQADDFYAQEVLQRKSKIWSHGRVVLLGDAGYCPSPMTGMGTSLAMVGAYVLAGEISKHRDDIPAALAAYDTTLRPYVDETQYLPPVGLKLFLPASAWTIKLLHTIAWLVMALRLDRVVEFFAVQAKQKWALPTYPDLNP